MRRIAPKQFLRLTDLKAQELHENSHEAMRQVESYMDDIGWPWKATQQQIDEWNAWLSNALA